MVFYLTFRHFTCNILLEVVMEKKQNVDVHEPIHISKILQDNYKWILAVLTFVGVLFLSFLKFVIFTKSKHYFSHYGLSIEFYQFEAKRLIYETAYSIILLLAIYIAAVSIYDVYVQLKQKKVDWCSLASFTVLNILAIFLITENFMNISYLLWFLILSMIECLIIILFRPIFKKIFKDIKSEEDVTYSFKEAIRDFFKFSFTSFTILLLGFLSFNFENIHPQKEYRIINENQVILYTANDYYLTLNCDVVGEDLIIYKGTETKISADRVQSKLQQYRNVYLK